MLICHWTRVGSSLHFYYICGLSKCNHRGTERAIYCPHHTHTIQLLPEIQSSHLTIYTYYTGECLDRWIVSENLRTYNTIFTGEPKHSNIQYFNDLHLKFFTSTSQQIIQENVPYEILFQNPYETIRCFLKFISLHNKYSIFSYRVTTFRMDYELFESLIHAIFLTDLNYG